jgi:hypothetical protein
LVNVSDRPTPPSALPDGLVARLEEVETERLAELAEYASELAEHRRVGPASERSPETDETDEPDEEVTDDSDRPDGVPGKATVTTKTINDNRYYYWQWRDGDQVKSKYKGPVDPNK